MIRSSSIGQPNCKLVYNSHFFLSLILILLVGCQQSATVPPEDEVAIAHQSRIDTIKQEFAPDKRVATFAIAAVRKPADQSVVLRGETNLPSAKAALLQDLQQEGLTYVDSIVVLPTTDLGNKTYGIVRQSVANLRTEPKHSAELTTQALLGTPLKILKRQRAWYRVQVPDGYIAWLDSGGFERVDSTQMHAWRNSQRVVVTNEYELVYASPAPDAAVVGDLVAGDILEHTASRNGYYQVRFPDDRQGYIAQSSAVNLETWLAGHRLDQAAIFATAQKYIGRPYLWGGTSGKGMDCSGFTKTVYFRHGLILPRDASQQAQAGTDLETNTNLEHFIPGDFLFFGNYRDDGSKRVTHVGIYLGEGRFIHSGADNGAVAIQSLRPEDPDYAPERLQSLIAARRMLDGDKLGTGIERLTNSRWYLP